MTRALRLIAFAIAIAAAVDPVVTFSARARPRVAVVAQKPLAEAERLRARIAGDLAGDFDVVPSITSDAAAAVVVGDRFPVPTEEAFVALGALAGPVATVSIPSTDVAIAGVAAPREVPAGTTIHVEADVDGRDRAGQSSVVVARIDGIEVARTEHRWTASRERWRAALDVVPFGEPPFVVRLDAGGAVHDVVVALRRDPIRVLVHDGRPSWASTFTRRALEADPRFQVESVVSSSRGLSARTAAATSLDDPHVDEFDAVVIGGLDALTPADVRSIDRYARARGGAVVLLPDERVTRGPAVDLVPPAAERLLERPARLSVAPGLAPLQASELLALDGSAEPLTAVASMPGDAAPVIVTVPRGRGRVLVSGALDAWRFRGTPDRAFDRFWQSAIAGLALAAPPAVDVVVEPAVLRPGETAGVIVRARRASTAARVSASVDGRPLRLWPEPEPGVYGGTFVADVQPRRSTVRATVADEQVQTASTVVPVRADARRASAGDAAPLAMLAAAHGGIDAPPGRVGDIERFIRGAVDAGREARPRRPMRSTWWTLPFAGCLAAEWWLRRRRGLR